VKGASCKATCPLPLSVTIPVRKAATARELNIRSAAQNSMDSMGTADIGAARLRKTEKSYLPQVDQITDRVGHLFPDADLLTLLVRAITNHGAR
jgi:hypothetical protein